jgi:chlorobactene glucosyltransferase
MLLACGVAWIGLVLWLLLRAVRQMRAYETVPLAPAGAAPSLHAAVAVIVPARDEARNIGACLAGLSAQRGLAREFSITVVDDGSRDDTAAIVARHSAADPRISRIAAGALPAGWAGKPHACWRGAASDVAASAEFLCFVDADVRTSPDLVAAALAAAQRDGADMLSLQPFQELGGFWERLVVPAGLLMIACAKDLRRLADAASPEAAVNGQFILVRRRVYFAVGGHAAVRAEISEDKALAGRVKQAGYRLRMAGAERLARTRMYRDLGSLWEGFSKNAVEIMGDARGTLLVAAAGVAFGWSALLLPAALGIAATGRPSAGTVAAFALALLGLLVVLGVEAGTMWHFRVPLVFALLFPLGFTVAGLLAAYSVWARRRGTVRWKGRRLSARSVRRSSGSARS